MEFSRFSLEELERIPLRADMADPPLDWETLRELCVGRMQQSHLAVDDRIRWAHLALAAISGKYGVFTDLKKVAEEVRVRSYMIREFGVSESDEARSPTALCSYVIQHLKMGRADVERMAMDWPALEKSQMLHLRRIKNVLTPVREIESLLDVDDPLLQEITAWILLQPKLP
ncbi:hypothetical protein ACWD0A_31280 [Streptomyces sp. NPDC002867]